MGAAISIVRPILDALAAKVSEYTVDFIARQVSYLFKYKSKFQNLEVQLQQLKDARERVQQDVNEANRQGEEIFSSVDRWLTEANGRIEDAVRQWEVGEEIAKQMCFFGLCPNFKPRYQLSRKAEKEANAIAQLVEERKGFDGVSYRRPPEGIAIRPVKDYEDFESRAGAFGAVMDALKNANMSIIGVYGMGGAGKTTLVKQVARQVKEEKLFDEVVMAAVTQIFDIRKIQDKIADELDLRFVTQSDFGRAGELLTRLKNKNVLVILDDIWEQLDLVDLGISYGGEQYQGCKILLTSRDLDALSSTGSLENVPIGTLEEEEAWHLFKKTAGDVVLRPDLHDTAKEVAKECAGLPIAIVTVGKAMKNKKHLSEWKDALRELRKPSTRNFKSITAYAYKSIEFSYKFLEDEEHQPTFLLCSIMGHDAAIEDLLKYGIGLGLYQGDTIEETRNRVFTLVSNLKTSSLLLDGSTSNRFDVHDVVRDVAILIALRDKNWLVGRDNISKGLSNEETMRKCKLISLQYAKISELLAHDQLECPNLTFFSLGSEDSSWKIPNNFFEGMQSLRVLDFAKMHFSSLPSSFCFLKNIHTLRFSNCMLENIAIIGGLNTLEILSLCRSKISVLSSEIGQLTKLKLLDLSDCRDLKVIKPNVLSRLTRLEELYLYYSFNRWEIERHEKPIANASLVELQHLPHLTALEVHISDEQALPKELFSEKLERYKISIGESWSGYEKSETSKKLKLKLNKSIHLYGSGVKTLLRKTEVLFLVAVNDAKGMLYDPNTEGFPHLKHLHICDVSDVEYIINSMKWVSCKAFPLLESLFLRNFIKLEGICDGQLKAECFGQLKKIEVHDCNVLKNFFSLAIAKELSGQLQEITVIGCENLTELIVEKRGEEVGEDGILEFSQLSFLWLEDLPSLMRLFYSEKKVSSSQQGVQSADERSIATSLFHQKVVFTSLKELILSSIPVEKVWHDQLPVMSFGVQNLTSLSVYKCHNLKNLFTSSMVKCFVQLKTLVVQHCKKMEEVIIVTEGLVEDQERNMFPKLDKLELCYLPNLKRFRSENAVGFLRDLSIESCPVLERFNCDSTTVGTTVENEAEKTSILMENFSDEISKHLFNEKVVFTGLKELILSSIPVEKLWHDQFPLMSFGVQNLTSLEVYGCYNLKNLFTSSMVKSFVQLKTLAVGYCDKIEVVIIDSEGLVEDQERNMFPKLDKLELLYLDNLKRFSSGNPIEFPFLRELNLVNCPALDTFSSPSKTVGTTVENQEGKSSISMEQLSSEIPKYLFNEKVALPMLEHLLIYGMENLERLWPNQLAEGSFAKLIFFRLVKCNKLLTVFPLSMRARLLRLGRLMIDDCNLLEEIFESQEGSSSATQSLSPKLIQSSVVQEKFFTFEFPQLTYLDLKYLPNLKSFFNKIHTTNWPSLKEMEVRGCDKVEMIFASEDTRISETDRKNQQEISIQQPLFWINKWTFPNLEKLTLGRYDGVKEIFHGQLLASDHFFKLKVLRLKFYPGLAIFPSQLYQLLSLPGLESLEIEACDFKEIVFQSGVGAEEGFQNLRNLVPSSVCFQNLMTLQVERCHGIIKLVTHSTAKSLVQLREMRISRCEKIEEIVEGSDGDQEEVKDEISFPQLNHLELVGLPKLESFCSSGNHTFGFPSLATVLVEACPKMKTFSQVEVNAPMLHNVRLKSYEGKMDRIWEGSLNSTIQQLFKGRVEEMQNFIEDHGSSSISSTQST